MVTLRGQPMGSKRWVCESCNFATDSYFEFLDHKCMTEIDGGEDDSMVQRRDLGQRD